MPNPKQALYSYMEVQLFNGSLLNTLTATSTNHSEIIALYEASRECDIDSIESPTIIYEDNFACVT